MQVQGAAASGLTPVLRSGAANGCPTDPAIRIPRCTPAPAATLSILYSRVFPQSGGFARETICRSFSSRGMECTF